MGIRKSEPGKNHKCSRTQTCKALGMAEWLLLSFKCGSELHSSQSKKGRQHLLKRKNTQVLLSPKAPTCPSLCRLADPEDSTGCVWKGMPVKLLRLPLPLHKRAISHSHPVGSRPRAGLAKGYRVRWDCGILLTPSQES